MDNTELTFARGDVLNVLQKDPRCARSLGRSFVRSLVSMIGSHPRGILCSGWWQCELRGAIGMVPSVGWVQELPPMPQTHPQLPPPPSTQQQPPMGAAPAPPQAAVLQAQRSPSPSHFTTAASASSNAAAPSWLIRSLQEEASRAQAIPASSRPISALSTSLQTTGAASSFESRTPSSASLSTSASSASSLPSVPPHRHHPPPRRRRRHAAMHTHSRRSPAAASAARTCGCRSSHVGHSARDAARAPQLQVASSVVVRRQPPGAGHDGDGAQSDTQQHERGGRRRGRRRWQWREARHCGVLVRGAQAQAVVQHGGHDPPRQLPAQAQQGHTVEAKVGVAIAQQLGVL